MTTETQESLIKRYKEALKKYNELANNPKQETQQSFEAAARQVSAMRQTIVRYGITLEGEAQA